MKRPKLNNGAENRAGGNERKASGNAHRPRRRFIFGAKAAGRDKSQPEKPLDHGSKAGSPARGKVVRAGNNGDPGAGAQSEVADLTETLKALLRLAREQGQLTYDDINDLLPDGRPPIRYVG